MYGDVWKWSGKCRTTPRNIGIDAYRIPAELYRTIDDTRSWVANETFPPDEIALRFSHRVVAIHPYPNGNGRLSRLIGDRLSIADGFALVEELREDRLDAWFAALADPTRRAMLAMLMRGECSVGALAAPHAMSLTAAARHVAVLDRAGLIERRRIGRRHLCRLRTAILAEAAGWLDRFARRDACRPAPVR